MQINCSTQKNKRATDYPFIIINETTNKTQFVDTNRQWCRKGKGNSSLSKKGTLVVE